METGQIVQVTNTRVKVIQGFGQIKSEGPMTSWAPEKYIEAAVTSYPANEVLYTTCANLHK
jgi:hypothetical protein